MTPTEFCNQFDVLYNNETSNKAPNLNGYEKSVFATKAELEILKNYFNPKGNKYTEGFDDSPKRHIDFSSLIVEVTTEQNDDTFPYFPNDAIAILEETAEEVLSETTFDDDTSTEVTQYTTPKKVLVVPISYTEYQRMLSRPYPYPNKRQIWRVTIDNGIKFVGHGPNSVVQSYTIRYVRIPEPIILEDLPTGLSIDSKTTQSTTIDAPKELHEEILQRAVELAKIAWLGDLNGQLTGGQRSE